MATKAKEKIDFGSFGAGAKYPWDEWLDGSQWIAKAGEDFTCPVGRFRVTVTAAARKRGMVARAKVIDPTKGVVAFQALPREAYTSGKGDKPSAEAPAD